MARSNFIRSIPKSLPKQPKVGAPGIPAVFDPTRGRAGVQHQERLPPLNTRVYTKKTIPDDPSQFYLSDFFDGGG